MRKNTNMIIKNFNEGYNLELDDRKKNISFTSCSDISDYLGLEISAIKDIVLNNKGSIIGIDLKDYNEYSYKEKDNKIEIIYFESKEDCFNIIEILSFERKIKLLMDEVKSLEKKYSSKQQHTREDIKACYEDDFILGVWDIEKYTEESGEGFLYFEDFLLNFIEQNLIFE